MLNEDSGDARRLLDETYKHNNSKEVRIGAGKALGYSRLRIWTHEHPVAATLTGIVSTAATTGVGYALFKYFSK